MEIRIVTMAEFHKNHQKAVFMKLRGRSRANKPQSGLFSRHYYKEKCRKKQCFCEKPASSDFPEKCVDKGARMVYR